MKTWCNGGRSVMVMVRVRKVWCNTDMDDMWGVLLQHKEGPRGTCCVQRRSCPKEYAFTNKMLALSGMCVAKEDISTEKGLGLLNVN
jgi:hypothetical protein